MVTTGARIVAIDIGTTTGKVGVFAGGRLVALRTRRFETAHPSSGTAEQDPSSWLSAVAQLVPLACADAGFSGVDAVGLTAESDTLVLADRWGRPVRPALLWMDQRGSGAAEDLERAVGLDEIHARTGLRSSFNFTFPKVAWVRQHEPAHFEQARWIFQPKDLLFHWLTGDALTDPSSASRTLGYDLRSATWWRPGLDALGVPAQLLPPVAETSTAFAELSPERAAELRLPAGTPVVVGAADRAAEALGLAASAHRAMVSSGTATGVAAVRPIDEATPDTRVITPRHAITGEVLALASIPTSGAVLDWLAGLTSRAGETATKRLLREAADTEPGTRGVAAMLSFAGARSLHWRPDARGAFVGLDLAVTRAELARSIVEAIGYESRTILDAVQAGTTQIEELVLTGGLHRSAFVAQTMADITGRAAVRYVERDAALAGAMLLAQAALGETDEHDLQAAARRRLGRGHRFVPDPRRSELYAGLAPAYLSGSSALLDGF